MRNLDIMILCSFVVVVDLGGVIKVVGFFNLM